MCREEDLDPTSERQTQLFLWLLTDTVITIFHRYKRSEEYSHCEDNRRRFSCWMHPQLFSSDIDRRMLQLVL